LSHERRRRQNLALLARAGVLAAAGGSSRRHLLSVWIVVVPLAVAGLSISSLPKYIALWPRADQVGAEAEWWKTVLLSLLNNLAAACAAFLLGNLSRWLWF
jgi:hypothetical protein